MKIEIGEIYTSYNVGSKAMVINIFDGIVEYEITYHPTQDIIGNKGKQPLERFKRKTVRYNEDYSDHKRKLKI